MFFARNVNAECWRVRGRHGMCSKMIDRIFRTFVLFYLYEIFVFVLIYLQTAVVAALDCIVVR